MTVSPSVQLGLEPRETLDVSGVAAEDIAHLQALVNSLRRSN